MRHLVHNVRYSTVPINFSVLTMKLHSSIAATLVFNDTKYSVFFIVLYPS